MKCQTIIDQNREEEVLIYVHRISERAKEIEAFVLAESKELFGYREHDIVKLSLSDIHCFSVQNSKVYAITQHDTYQMKERLYALEDSLDERFIKINQSCIANIKKIKRFDASFAGSLIVTFEGGHKDYVSRRRLKAVKERIGIS